MATRKTNQPTDEPADEEGQRRRRREKETVHPEQQGHDESEAAASPTGQPRANGATTTDNEPASSAAGMADAAGDETMKRAEDMVDRIAEKVAQFTASFGRQLLRMGARAREEAEDIWAEAQHIRQGRSSSEPPAE